MTESYVKLFSTITTSTIWEAPHATRIVWVTMLAVSDRRGEIQASVPGLARIANVSLEECEAALAAFMAPDKYSRTEEHEGRRIERIAGGWRLLNYGKYREKLDKEAALERKREWDRQRRPSGGARAKQSDASPTVRRQSDASPTSPTQAEAEALEEQQEQELPKTTFSGAPAPISSAVALRPVANGSPEPDPIFGHGLAFLLSKGMREKGARSLLGALRKQHGEVQAAALLAQAEREDVSEPAAWLCAASQARAPPGARAPPAAKDPIYAARPQLS